MSCALPCRCLRFLLACVVLVATTTFAGAAIPEEKLEHVKQATAFVEIPSYVSGTAVCINPKGVFITCEHVVSALPDGGSVTLVTSPDTPNTKSWKATIVARSVEDDLAVLLVDSERDFPFVPVATQGELLAGVSVTALGFPLGREMAEESKPLPRVRIRTGVVEKLKPDDKATSVLGLHIKLFPGDSGGPVLNDNAQLVGITQSGQIEEEVGIFGITTLRSLGECYAVAAPRIQPLIGPPRIFLVTPELVRFENRRAPQTLTLRRVALVPGGKDGEITAVIEVPGSPASRKATFEPVGKDMWQAKIAPIDEQTELADKELMVSCKVIEKSKDSERFGPTGGSQWTETVADVPLEVGGRTKLALGEIEWIELTQKPRVHTTDGRVLFGAVSGLPKLGTKLKRNPAGSSEMIVTVQARTSLRGSIPIRTEIKRDGKPFTQIDSSFRVSTDLANPYISRSTIRELPVVSVIPLPGPATEVLYAADGRYAVARIDSLQILAVCDTERGVLLGVIPLERADTRFAAGKDSVFVVANDGKHLERWDIKTMKQDAAADTSIPDAVSYAAMGGNSSGPVLLVTPTRAWAFDAATLKPIELSGLEQFATDVKSEHFLAAAPGGLAFGFGAQIVGPKIIRLDLQHRVASGEGFRNNNPRLLLLDADGTWVSQGATIRQPPDTSSDGMAEVESRSQKVLLPIDQAGFCLELHCTGNGPRLTFRELTNDTTILTLPILPDLADRVPQERGVPLPETRQLAMHIHYSAAECRLVTLSRAGNRLTTRRLDVKQELDARRSDYLFLTVVPPTILPSNGEYRHTLQVASSFGGVTCQLVDGPEGMKISPSGQIEWTAGASRREAASVALSVTDKAGHTFEHRFRITPVGGGTRYLRTRVSPNYTDKNPMGTGCLVEKGDVVSLRATGARGPTSLMVLANGQSHPIPKTAKVTIQQAGELRFYCGDPGKGEIRVETEVTPGDPTQ